MTLSDMPLPRAWRVPPHVALDWRRWPDENEYVFYHGATGDTHRLSELAGCIMEMALTGPVETAALRQWLLTQGVTAKDNTLDHVLASLAQLEFLEPIQNESMNNAVG